MIGIKGIILIVAGLMTSASAFTLEGMNPVSWTVAEQPSTQGLGLIDGDEHDVVVREWLPGSRSAVSASIERFTPAPVEQRSCGSCAAFAAVGWMVTRYNVVLASRYPLNRLYGLDLSEQQVFSCGGGKCDVGWTISKAAEYMKRWGAADEACMPYVAADLTCAKAICPDWKTRMVAIKSYKSVSFNNMCAAIAAGYPVLTRMDVYADFRYYKSGIYRHTAGGYEGGHAIVGIACDQNTLTFRNSWGGKWGEGGNFRIYRDDKSIGYSGYVADVE